MKLTKKEEMGMIKSVLGFGLGNAFTVACNDLLQQVKKSKKEQVEFYVHITLDMSDKVKLVEKLKVKK